MCPAHLVLEAFLVANPDAHALFRPDVVPSGGLSVWHPDWMHTKCLGTDATLLGSALLYLVKEAMVDETPEAHLQRVWMNIRLFYRAHKTKNRLGRLTLKMLTQEPFPRLKAKAIETRDLIPAVEHVFREWLHIVPCAWFHRLLLMSKRMDELVFGNPSYLLSVVDREALRATILNTTRF